MSDPFPIRGKELLTSVTKRLECELKLNKNNKILFIIVGLMIMGSLGRFLSSQPVFYAHAYTGEEVKIEKINSPLFEVKNFFDDSAKESEKIKLKAANKKTEGSTDLEINLLDMVGNTPIREMVPFIAKRENKVAAFLVGIAKKESSFGLASPSKNGSTCYNYWGYKGQGSRGTSLGYSCFASAEEAVDVVGDRIEVLVDKNRNTPSKMVDTWKCGTSCSGDPGAAGWVSTVALYFDKIVNANS